MRATSLGPARDGSGGAPLTAFGAFTRVVDGGDFIGTLTAPTAAERIAASAALGREIMQRTGALFAVAQQAAVVEPLIAGFWQQGREQHRHAQAAFWTRMADDGLLDLPWLIDTSSILAAAETYLLITRMTGWDFDTYQNWLATTWTRLATPPAGGALPVPAAT